MEHLIPQVWFTGLPQWALLVITAIGVGILVRGANWLVDGASEIHKMVMSRALLKDGQDFWSWG